MNKVNDKLTRNLTLIFSYGKPRLCMKKHVITRNGSSNLKQINKITKTDGNPLLERGKLIHECFSF